MFDSLNDSELKTSPRQSSASISFSTHGTFPMDYSSEIDIDNESDDASLLQLPISPVSQDNDEEEDDNDEHEGRSAPKEECKDIVAETVEADEVEEATSD